MSKRFGRQTPTTSLVLPYTKTKGNEAVDIYNKTERTAREWQELLIYDIMAVDEDDMWIHSTFGYSVPRRNGKTEDVIMRIMWGITHGEKIIYTAHMISTAHAVWETICYLLDGAGIKYASVKAKGQENIRLYDEHGKAYKLTHLVNFRTRSNTGGLGEGYDLLIIDEAQEYTIDQESALKYVISASSNPQIIMLGTPPTAISHGTVFQKLREKVLNGDTKYIGWAEWSVQHMQNPHDIENWYETNPSLGYGLTERVIENEITTDDVDFNIQRLGHWLSYSQASEFSKTEWSNLKVTAVPDFKEKLYVGIKFGKDGKNVAMSIATKLDDGKVYIESIDCQSIRNGTMWIISFLKQADVEKVVIDGASGQKTLSDEIKDFGIKVKTILPKVADVIVANSMFEQAVTSTKLICHNDQPSLTQVVTNCKRRAIGTAGGFGYMALLEEHEIALLDSVVLAYWMCASNKKKKRKQRVRY
ncbi:terminase [Coprobacillus sp. AF33-1AC]|uniref:terminase n=1 Tax=Coprobacillus sp. AF33-1AC TaxID=2292032 RepID=UPI000E4747D1|nr:terminase [Coprobacillus sp. AF33-1AC]RHM59661.1 terminase [Coprobacillus sp. AF33-1AC]